MINRVPHVAFVMEDKTRMDILGITLGHDSSFALGSYNKIIGIMEAERYFRRKRYKLHCLSLNPGKQISGYHYVDLADL